MAVDIQNLSFFEEGSWVLNSSLEIKSEPNVDSLITSAPTGFDVGPVPYQSIFRV